MDQAETQLINAACRFPLDQPIRIGSGIPPFRALKIGFSAAVAGFSAWAAIIEWPRLCAAVAAILAGLSVGWFCWAWTER
jgi:hypothetical protein